MRSRRRATSPSPEPAPRVRGWSASRAHSEGGCSSVKRANCPPAARRTGRAPPAAPNGSRDPLKAFLSVPERPPRSGVRLQPPRPSGGASTAAEMGVGPPPSARAARLGSAANLLRMRRPVQRVVASMSLPLRARADPLGINAPFPGTATVAGGPARHAGPGPPDPSASPDTPGPCRQRADRPAREGHSAEGGRAQGCGTVAASLRAGVETTLERRPTGYTFGHFRRRGHRRPVPFRARDRAPWGRPGDGSTAGDRTNRIARDGGSSSP